MVTLAGGAGNDYKKIWGNFSEWYDKTFLYLVYGGRYMGRYICKS